MDRPCDICGGYTDQGVAYEMIVTCSKCRLSCEHLYCMRDCISYQDRDKWVCESCTKENGRPSPKSKIKGDQLASPANIAHYDERHLASPSKFHKSSGWQAHSSRQKAVTSGKVRYITHQEVQQLYRTTSPIKSSAVCKTVAPKSPLSRVNAPSDVTQPRRGRPPKKQNISISEIGSSFSIVRTVTPPRHGKPPKMLSISKINQQASQIMKHSQEKWSPGTHTKGHGIKEQPMDASVLSRGAATSSRKIVKEPNKLSCTPSSSRDSSLNMSSGGETSAGEHNHSDGEERDLLNIFSDLHHRSYLPALHATWKGDFLIYDADTPAQFFGGIQAQLPCRVHRRVYDISQKMPPVLQATLLPQLHLSDDPFHDECAELEDVALYFFPDDNIASSRETHASLFEVMDTKNSVLRIYFEGEDGVELLVYTSKQLRLDLPDIVTCPKTQNFLWGIFRPEGDCQADIGDSATTADMEVDMVGGKMVGSVDIVIPKDLLTPSRMSQQPICPKDTSNPSRMSRQSISPKDTSTPSRVFQQPICPKDTSIPSRMSQQPVVNPKESPTPNRMSELQPLMTLRESLTTCRMSEEPIKTPSSSTPGGMTAVQQLLSVAKGKHSSYLDKKRALETTIAQLLGVTSEEPTESDTSTSSAMKTTLALQQVKLEKEEGDMAGTTSAINVKLEKEEDELGGTSATVRPWT